MIRTILLLSVFFPLCCFSQNLINKTRSGVKKELVEYIEKNVNVKATLVETASSLVLKIPDGDRSPATFTYQFDKAGKCNSEKVVAACDSCIARYLEKVLTNNKYSWKKINENQYVSSYAQKMIIELPAIEKSNSFIILRTNWSKKIYELTTEN